MDRHEKVIEWAKKDFSEHKANLRMLDGIVELVWQKPGTGVNSIVYLMRKGFLYVSGDLGEAVYCWSGRVTLPFLNDCSLDYFQGKCEASETGRRFEVWDSDKAEARINRFPEDYGEDFNIELYKTGKDAMIGAASTKEEWAQWLGTDEAYELLGADFWEYGDIGIDIHPRCIYHWLGLKLAYEQLKETNPELLKP